MLRQTQSAIVFVQQLGRGLRKADGKEYLVVIDFIGNYANNFLIPIALFGDESLNKESLRKGLIDAEEIGVLPGLSSVRFDKISQDRILRSIADTSLDSMLRASRQRSSRCVTAWAAFRTHGTSCASNRPTQSSWLPNERTTPRLSRRYSETAGQLAPAESKALQLLSHEVLPVEACTRGGAPRARSTASANCQAGRYCSRVRRGAGLTCSSKLRRQCNRHIHVGTARRCRPDPLRGSDHDPDSRRRGCGRRFRRELVRRGMSLSPGLWTTSSRTGRALVTRRDYDGGDPFCCGASVLPKGGRASALLATQVAVHALRL